MPISSPSAPAGAPILLLDEIAAHLDPVAPRACSTGWRRGGQVWMTGTEAALFDGIGAATHFALPARRLNLACRWSSPRVQAARAQTVPDQDKGRSTCVNCLLLAPPLPRPSPPPAPASRRTAGTGTAARDGDRDYRLIGPASATLSRTAPHQSRPRLRDAQFRLQPRRAGESPRRPQAPTAPSPRSPARAATVSTGIARGQRPSTATAATRTACTVRGTPRRLGPRRDARL